MTDILSAYATLMCCKNIQEIHEDGVDTRRNAPEL